MRILLYEHYTAGGEPADVLEQAQATAQRALVAALAVDLGAAGGHEVRLASAWPVATLDEDRRWAEAVLLLAPEGDDRLAELAAELEEAGLRLLGSSAAATRLVADKMGLILALGEHNLPVPKSWTIGFEREDQLERITRRLGFPVVVKPVAGAGGRGVLRVDSAATLPAAVEQVRAVTSLDSFLLQEYIPGVAAGVGLAVAAGQARPLGLWGALVSDPPALVVERWATPFDHPGVEAAVQLATQAAQAIPGLAGYVEVDLVLGADGPVLLEISTRPTLGALVLRRSRRLNLARLILEASLHQRLPDTRLWSVPWPALVDLANPSAALSPEMPA